MDGSIGDLLAEHTKAVNVSLDELQEIDFSNKKLTSMESDLLNRCVNLRELNISKNRIKSLSGLCLPNLEVLNFENNSVSDITFLSDLPLLKTLYFDGNPLNAADRYIAVDLLPNLEKLDGKSCDDAHKVLQEFEKQLNAEAMRIYLSKYRLLLESSCDFEEIIQQRRTFTREVTKQIPSFTMVPPKFQRYKVQSYVEKLFRLPQSPRKKNPVSLEVSSPSAVLKRLNDLQLHSPKPSKRPNTLESSPVTPSSAMRRLRLSSPAKPHTENTDIHLPTPFALRKKQQILASRGRLQRSAKSVKSSDQLFAAEDSFGAEGRCVDYEPQIFLRCHVPENDPEDCGTQIWAASFEPDIHDEGKTTDLVATCGRNVVCFINCKTSHVLKRFKCSSNDENLFALDWTILGKNTKLVTSILATGGLDKKVYLIHPSQLKCYYTFKAHSKTINCLRFHPTEKSWLFSGGEDCFINLWDIGEISLSDYSNSHKKLMTFTAKDRLIQMELSKTYNCLFATSDTSLAIWDLNANRNKWKAKSSVVLKLPENYRSKRKGVIDGLAIVSDTHIALKQSQCGKIALADISSVFPGGKLTTAREVQLSSKAIFSWSDCNLDYIYMDFCRGDDILACGDDCGQLWLYDLQRFVKGKTNKRSQEPDLPTVVLPWPKLVFEDEDLPMRPNIIINTLKFNWNGNYLVACTNSNLVCVWRQTQ